MAVVNNISLDHKSMEELRALFSGFAAKAERVVLNLDNAETAALAAGLDPARIATFSLADPAADFLAGPRTPTPGGIAFAVTARRSGKTAEVALQTPGSTTRPTRWPRSPRPTPWASTWTMPPRRSAPSPGSSGGWTCWARQRGSP